MYALRPSLFCIAILLIVMLCLAGSSPAMAQDSISEQATTEFAADVLDSGDTAWILVATALVLFMNIPGLALFYGGLVRTKNVLSVLMQCLALTALISVIWLAFGYTVAFDTTAMVKGEVNLNSFVGGSSDFK